MTYPKYLFASVFILFFINSLSAQTEITPSEAQNHVGMSCIVKAKIVSIKELEQVIFIDLDKNFPNNEISVVIFGSAFEEFEESNFQSFVGKEVSILGIITIYKEKPQIILEQKEQFKVLN